jgi:hypothetical protein
MATMLGLTRYQWLVLFAAWLGWGFASLPIRTGPGARYF